MDPNISRDEETALNEKKTLRRLNANERRRIRYQNDKGYRERAIQRRKKNMEQQKIQKRIRYKTDEAFRNRVKERSKQQAQDPKYKEKQRLKRLAKRQKQESNEDEFAPHPVSHASVQNVFDSLYHLKTSIEIQERNYNQLLNDVIDKQRCQKQKLDDMIEELRSHVHSMISDDGNK